MGYSTVIPFLGFLVCCGQFGLPFSPPQVSVPDVLLEYSSWTLLSLPNRNTLHLLQTARRYPLPLDQRPVDLLVVLDTLAMHQQHQLRSEECHDVRFYVTFAQDDSHSPNYSGRILSHWIEGGRLGPKTRFWIRLEEAILDSVENLWLVSGHRDPTNGEVRFFDHGDRFYGLTRHGKEGCQDHWEYVVDERLEQSRPSFHHPVLRFSHDAPPLTTIDDTKSRSGFRYSPPDRYGHGQGWVHQHSLHCESGKPVNVTCAGLMSPGYQGRCDSSSYYGHSAATSLNEHSHRRTSTKAHSRASFPTVAFQLCSASSLASFPEHLVYLMNSTLIDNGLRRWFDEDASFFVKTSQATEPLDLRKRGISGSLLDLQGFVHGHEPEIKHPTEGWGSDRSINYVGCGTRSLPMHKHMFGQSQETQLPAFLSLEFVSSRHHDYLPLHDVFLLGSFPVSHTPFGWEVVQEFQNHFLVRDFSIIGFTGGALEHAHRSTRQLVEEPVEGQFGTYDYPIDLDKREVTPCPRESLQMSLHRHAISCSPEIPVPNWKHYSSVSLRLVRRLSSPVVVPIDSGPQIPAEGNSTDLPISLPMNTQQKPPSAVVIGLVVMCVVVLAVLSVLAVAFVIVKYVLVPRRKEQLDELQTELLEKSD